MSVADFTRTATSTSAFVTGDGVAVLVFLAPKFYFFFFCALDASFAHLLVVLNLRFGELSVFPEDYVETQTEYAKAYENKSCK